MWCALIRMYGHYNAQVTQYAMVSTAGVLHTVWCIIDIHESLYESPGTPTPNHLPCWDHKEVV